MANLSIVPVYMDYIYKQLKGRAFIVLRAYYDRVLLVLKVLWFSPSPPSSAAMDTGREWGGGEDIEDKQRQ